MPTKYIPSNKKTDSDIDQKELRERARKLLPQKGLRLGRYHNDSIILCPDVDNPVLDQPIIITIQNPTNEGVQIGLAINAPRNVNIHRSENFIDIMDDIKLEQAEIKKKHLFETWLIEKLKQKLEDTGNKDLYDECMQEALHEVSKVDM